MNLRKLSNYICYKDDRATLLYFQFILNVLYADNHFKNKRKQNKIQTIVFYVLKSILSTIENIENYDYPQNNLLL